MWRVSQRHFVIPLLQSWEFSPEGRDNTGQHSHDTVWKFVSIQSRQPARLPTAVELDLTPNGKLILQLSTYVLILPRGDVHPKNDLLMLSVSTIQRKQRSPWVRSSVLPTHWDILRNMRKQNTNSPARDDVWCVENYNRAVTSVMNMPH